MNFRNLIQIFCVLLCLTYLAGCKDDGPTSTSPAPTISGAPNESITSPQSELSQIDSQITENNETSIQPVTSIVNAGGEQVKPRETIAVNNSINEFLLNASKSGDVETVRAILDAGADINTGNFCTSIFWAARAFDCRDTGEAPDNPVIMELAGKEAPYHHSVIDLLFDRGASLMQSSFLNLNHFLERASRFEHVQAVTRALEAGADPNMFKPLLIASYTGNVQIVRALILAGAEVNLKTCKGDHPNARQQQYTSLDIARSEGHKDVERILLDAGALTATDAENIRDAVCHSYR